MIILFYSLLLGKDTKKTGEKDEVYFNIFHRDYKIPFQQKQPGRFPVISSPHPSDARCFSFWLVGVCPLPGVHVSSGRSTCVLRAEDSYRYTDADTANTALPHPFDTTWSNHFPESSGTREESGSAIFAHFIEDFYLS